MQLWYASTNDNWFVENQSYWLSCLAESHQNYYRAIKNRKRASQYLLSRTLIYLALVNKTGSFHNQFQIKNYNQIITGEGSSYSVSISHCREFACVVISDYSAQIGIDLEYQKQRDIKAIAQSYYSAHEAQYFSENISAEINADFYQCWTLKEAMTKACASDIWTIARQLDCLPVVSKKTDVLKFNGKNYYSVCFKSESWHCAIVADSFDCNLDKISFKHDVSCYLVLQQVESLTGVR